MNKNLKEVLVRNEYNGQVWFEVRIFSSKNLGLYQSKENVYGKRQIISLDSPTNDEAGR